MAQKKQIQPGEMVGLKLTQAQRALLLDALLLIPKEVEWAIRTTPADEPLMFTLDDLDDLSGHVAAGANHAESKALRDKLDRIYRKIETLLGSFTDEAATEEGGPSDLIETLINMITGAKPIIPPMPPTSKKGEAIYSVTLTNTQRESLVAATRLRRGLKNKIGEAPEDTQAVGFTRKELDEMASEVDLAVEFAPPPYKKRLEAVMAKLEDLLDALEEDEPIKPGRKEAKGNNRIYQLKITLKDVRPPIWRRVLVPDCSLAGLHEVIQVAMGWGNCHLYDYEVGGERYTDPRSMADLDMEDAGKVKLGRVAPREKAKFRYTYDFGDHWQHEVLVEKILPQEPGKAYPVCIAGKRACPPEDCGGPWGYMEFAEAVRDPEHEQHDEVVEWRGEFDPEAFDLDAVNERLKGILR
ncbi:plasmid pRiA4b ORF-3 family protein [Tundrisphaera sp. TA3]|uniref:plasmid pRiA4b ORF-3 family protein n=1 Tax=Tundrisphaera sp. TA3 TaxID=3435775 RepID=UPI003EBD1DA8